MGFHLQEELKTVKLIEAESRTVVSRGWEEGKMDSCWAMGIEFQLRKMKKF